MATNAPEAADLDNRPDEITTDEKPPAPAADLAELDGWHDDPLAIEC